MTPRGTQRAALPRHDRTGTVTVYHAHPAGVTEEQVEADLSPAFSSRQMRGHDVDAVGVIRTLLRAGIVRLPNGSMYPAPSFVTRRPSMTAPSCGDDISTSPVAPVLLMSKKAAVFSESGSTEVRALLTLILAGTSPAAPVVV